MKALLVNGSPRENGNTYIALKEVADRLEENGIETEIFWIGHKAVQGCISCNGCVKKGFCVLGDELYMNFLEKLRESDALIVGSPTYFGGPTGSLCALLDRVFYSCAKDLQNKVWASVIVCRRGRASCAFQRLNMYADMRNMIHATSQYWNIAYGWKKGETAEDKEGLQTMRTLADNVSWLMKCVENRKGELREREKWELYNYIRKQ
ncbi:MAG: flavodoxin family protein [Parabacteroides sp.]|nr:flavodoxin family protein [Parabacteroides sp.]